MKKFFPAILFALLFGNTSYSQTRQGKFVVSGGTNVKLLFSKLDPNTNDVVDKQVKVQDYAVDAGVGYFIIDNLAININILYQHSYSKKQLYLGPVYEEDIQNTLNLAPSITYFFPVEGKLRPNISLGAGYVTSKERNNQIPSSDNIVYHFGGLSLNAGAGVSYFLNRSVSLDLGFQYLRNKLNDKTNERRSQLQKIYGVMAGLSVYF